MRKFFRELNAGLYLMFCSFFIEVFLGETALREFREAMGKYVRTGVWDHSWANKF